MRPWSAFENFTSSCPSGNALIPQVTELETDSYLEKLLPPPELVLLSVILWVAQLLLDLGEFPYEISEFDFDWQSVS